MENEELENVDKAVISGTQRVSPLSIGGGGVVSGNTGSSKTFSIEEAKLLPLVCFSFANTAKGWVQPLDAMLRAAHGSITFLAQQPVGPSSP